MLEEAGDSDTGNGVEGASGEADKGNLEGPAPLLGTGILNLDACLIDSAIAFASSSSSSLEIFDSSSERASARLSCSSS